MTAGSGKLVLWDAALSGDDLDAVKGYFTEKWLGL